MNVSVIGLWHLGSVTAACTAAAGHCVTAWDPDAALLDRFAAGVPPVAEPGLPELLADLRQTSRLLTARSLQAAVSGADAIWITFDTPVDESDRADTAYVLDYARQAVRHAPAGALVVVSSQLPAGSMRAIEAFAHRERADAGLSFACAPENLRLGKALDVFRNPDRIVIGVRDQRGRERADALLRPISDRLEFMGIESAEMTKHAINAFLAASVTFINEIGALCERVGADAAEVSRGLKTERRIGPQAYLSPGTAFAGGTLARDVHFLQALGASTGRETPLVDGIAASNQVHRGWIHDRLRMAYPDLAGRRVAVWGLTYKPGTDTLRRSSAIELVQQLLDAGVHVQIHDPAAGELPPAVARAIRFTDPLDAASGADALVVATEWPQYRDVAVGPLLAAVRTPLVIDPNGFLRDLSSDGRFRHVRVGQPA